MTKKIIGTLTFALAFTLTLSSPNSFAGKENHNKSFFDAYQHQLIAAAAVGISGIGILMRRHMRWESNLMANAFRRNATSAAHHVPPPKGFGAAGYTFGMLVSGASAYVTSKIMENYNNPPNRPWIEGDSKPRLTPKDKSNPSLLENKLRDIYLYYRTESFNKFNLFGEVRISDELLRFMQMYEDSNVEESKQNNMYLSLFEPKSYVETYTTSEDKIVSTGEMGPRVHIAGYDPVLKRAFILQVPSPKKLRCKYDPTLKKMIYEDVSCTKDLAHAYQLIHALSPGSNLYIVGVSDLRFADDAITCSLIEIARSAPKCNLVCIHYGQDWSTNFNLDAETGKFSIHRKPPESRQEGECD